MQPLVYYDEKLHTKSLVQRYQIQFLWDAGMTQKFIANQQEVHPSTICRELNRNIAKRGRTSGYYIAVNAQRKTDLRHQEKPKQVLFTSNMKQVIIRRLTLDKWSPEIISKIGHRTGECPISHEWIYQWIWAS